MKRHSFPTGHQEDRDRQCLLEDGSGHLQHVDGQDLSGAGGEKERRYVSGLCETAGRDHGGGRGGQAAFAGMLVAYSIFFIPMVYFI